MLDPNDLFGTGLVTESESETETALQHVAQRISGQYGEVIAVWTRAVLSSKEPAETSGVAATVENLIRLAESSQNRTQTDLLRALQEILQSLQGTRPRDRRGDRARVRLRDWIPEYAKTLVGADATRLLKLVRWDAGAAPLMSELRGVAGLGPRRLTRLYSAGLGDVDAVATAEPEEVAAVTGIPFAVAVDAVSRAREYAVTERRRCVEDIQVRATRLHALLNRLEDGPDPELVEVARVTLGQVEHAFKALLRQEKTE